MRNIPSTITEQVSNIKNLEISYRVLHPRVQIENTVNNEVTIVPYSSVVSKYKDFLHEIIITMDLDDKQRVKYMYKPKMLSEDLYGTTELWDTILLLNECVYVSEFKPKTVKVYDPNKFKRYINEIMLLEEENGNINF